MANTYDLAKMLADVASSPKVYVVPDEQLQQKQPIPRSQIRYGEEVPRQSVQQATTSLADAISGYQKANPIKIPLPAGTKTLQAKQFDFEKEQFAKEWPYKEASYQYELNKPYYKPDDITDNAPTKNESLNQLSQRIYGLKDQGYSREEVESAIYSSAGDLGSSISTKDVQGLLDQIYGEKNTNDPLGVINDQLGGGETSAEMSPEEAMKQALKERPWWQKAIDILPGKQFR